MPSARARRRSARAPASSGARPQCPSPWPRPALRPPWPCQEVPSLCPPRSSRAIVDGGRLPPAFEWGGSVRPDVLVQPEDVVRVVAPLQRLEAVVLLRPVGLPDALLALLHQEVDVDRRVVGRERRPEAPRPFGGLVEAVPPLRDRRDVEREAGGAAVERSGALRHARDRASHLPDREPRQL